MTLSVFSSFAYLIVAVYSETSDVGCSSIANLNKGRTSLEFTHKHGKKKTERERERCLLAVTRKGEIWGGIIEHGI